jgi:glycolate oxidase iron-sulfur subunit
MINPDETTSPRGFLDLLGSYQKGDLHLDKNVKNIFESCFLCTACVEICPNSLPVDMLIEQARNDIQKKYGLSWFKKLFFYLLRNRKIMDLFAKWGYVLQTCGFKIEEEMESMKSRFYLPIIKNNRLLPRGAKESFLNSQEEDVINNGGEKKVALFVGCLANYSYTNTAKSLLNILKELKIDVDLIKKQHCCGAPAYFTGDFDTVEFLSKKNIEYFESFIDEVDAIIIPEATCSAMMKVDYAHFYTNQDNWKQRALKIADKIYMATEYLDKKTDLKDILKQRGKNLDSLITYHDPCHAKKMQGIYREPRNLLTQNYNIKEMSDSNRCCGFGGVTMQTEKFQFAKAAGMPKAQMIKDTKATIVSSECSACRMQINSALYYADVNTTFKNPLELISDALGYVEES